MKYLHPGSYSTSSSYGSNTLKTVSGKLSQSDVTSLEYAFSYCSNLTEIDADLFNDCTKVTSFSYTFCRCSSLTSIPDGLFANNPAVTSFNYAFYHCQQLRSIPENLFANNTAVTDFSHTFYYCASLTSIPENLFANNSAVTDFSYTFYHCSSLTSIPEGLFANNTAVTSFSNTFFGCTSLTTVPESLLVNNSAVTDFSYTFSYCASLLAIPHDWCCYSANITNMQFAHWANTVARQIAINAYKISSSSYARLCNSGESRAYLERVFVWNITSTTLGYLGEYYAYYPTTTVSSGGTLFIGRTETDEGWYDDSLLDGQTIADSTFVAQMLTKGYNKVYVGTCKLGEYEFKSNGYIEKAGTYISKSETITIPTVEEILASVNS